MYTEFLKIEIVAPGISGVMENSSATSVAASSGLLNHASRDSPGQQAHLAQLLSTIRNGA